ncbi:ABC-type dipeptide/oligopeptide/nickel transport system, ATPase component [Arboricoccus pini]|uniref:ABC-type dipeptide/oligopeptide/nickel transport system, ATPase component n=1 Tax=Arboricoccus pini TaxID=1963835 RepID=A0A212R5E0_9PROT|nr:ATP-binding cassette domain-containing protein [Arboricoccus pini]SNB67196.1 ABC-type dipeptide/oligopeptide/nickel transport system, ATPase component [Arboricoccus pini]
MVGQDVLFAAQIVDRHGGQASLALRSGSCLAITGASGSGKSTLLRRLADLDPYEGQIHLAGREARTYAPCKWRSSVVYCPAEPAWWAETVAAHFVEYPGDLADRLGLSPDLAGRTAERCSTGERQRLALLRALSRKPAVLLLDEPTAALDPESTAKVEGLLRDNLTAGLGIILVTHDSALADRLGDCRLVLTAAGLQPA